MSMTHIGKIGRLSRDIRQILGERIEDGIPNKELVKWLNGLPAVREVLELRFGGRAITEQNLSEWKQTGHGEWRRREERRALALRLTEQRDEEALEPEEALAEREISDRLGRELGMEMALLALALVEQEGDTETRWKRLCAVYREVSQLRRDDHRAERIRLRRERWEREAAMAEEEREAQAAQARKQELLDACQAPRPNPVMAEAFGGGEPGRTMAELMERIQRDQPAEELTEWLKQAQEKWVKPAGAAGEGRGGNDEIRMTNDGGTQQQVPGSNRQGPGEAGVPKTGENLGNPGKSN